MSNKPETIAYVPIEYSNDDSDIEIYQPFSGKKRSSSSKRPPSKDIPEDPKPKASSNMPTSKPKPRKESDDDVETTPPPKPKPKPKKSSEDHKNASECQDPGCEMCRALKRENSGKSGGRPKFVVVDGEAFVPPRQVEDEPKEYKKIPDSVPISVAKKPQYNFTKKLGQLDAAIKMLTTKVDENIMKEKYLAADELQNALNNLKETKIELIDLLDDREEKLDNGNLKAAQTLKNAYDEKLAGAINMDEIKPHLTTNEFMTLQKLKKN